VIPEGQTAGPGCLATLARAVDGSSACRSGGGHLVTVQLADRPIYDLGAVPVGIGQCWAAAVSNYWGMSSDPDAGLYLLEGAAILRLVTDGLSCLGLGWRRPARSRTLRVLSGGVCRSIQVTLHCRRAYLTRGRAARRGGFYAIDGGAAYHCAAVARAVLEGGIQRSKPWPIRQNRHRLAIARWRGMRF